MKKQIGTLTGAILAFSLAANAVNATPPAQSDQIDSQITSLSNELRKKFKQFTNEQLIKSVNSLAGTPAFEYTGTTNTCKNTVIDFQLGSEHILPPYQAAPQRMQKYQPKNREAERTGIFPVLKDQNNNIFTFCLTAAELEEYIEFAAFGYDIMMPAGIIALEQEIKSRSSITDKARLLSKLDNLENNTQQSKDALKSAHQTLLIQPSPGMN